jgi:hypothetical protein
MQAVDPGDVENRSFHTRCCHGKTTRTLEVMFGRDTFLGRVPKCLFLYQKTLCLYVRSLIY